ncbi:hypothetical protein [Lihuaxuella thermophila]|nr:hypothetical protein [Lihuaxuella thermophila]
MADNHQLKNMNDMYVRTFGADECAIIEFALRETYQSLKDYEDRWHLEQKEKIKKLLSEKFEIKIN